MALTVHPGVSAERAGEIFAAVFARTLNAVPKPACEILKGAMRSNGAALETAFEQREILPVRAPDEERHQRREPG